MHCEQIISFRKLVIYMNIAEMFYKFIAELNVPYCVYQYKHFNQIINFKILIYINTVLQIRNKIN